MKRINKVFASTMVFVIVSSMLLMSMPIVKSDYEWNRYHRYSEIVAGLENLGSLDVAQVETIGETNHTIEIKAIKISDNVHLDEADEPDILFVGLHHAREWISAEVPYYLAVNLVQRYATDPTVKALVDSCEIWVVPVLNPDGYWWSHEYDRYWRKNTRLVGEGIYGVDLDRNYGFQWGLDLDPDDIRDGSPNPIDETYWGPNSFSEEETLAIRDLLTDPQHNFEAVLSYHSYSQLILYPWGYTEDPAPDSGLMSTLAEEMADTIHNVHGETYIPMQASELYLVSGDFADWVYGTMGIPAFTIELRPESADPWWQGFLLPEGEILDTCEENWPAALFLISYVAQVRTCLVVRGNDNHIYYRMCVPSSNSWGSWNVVPTGATCDSPAAAVYNGKLYMVVRGMDGSSLWFGWISLTDDSFHGWTGLGGSTPSAPTLVSNGYELVLVVRGLDNRIYYRFYDCSSDEWYDWLIVPTGSTSDSPAAAVMGDYLHLVVRGMTGGLFYQQVYIPTEDYLGWTRMSGDTPSAPALTTNYKHEGDYHLLYLVVRGMSDGIYWALWDGSWTGWSSLPGATNDAPGVAVQPSTPHPNARLHLAVRGMRGGLYHGLYDLNAFNFVGWTLISGDTPSPPTLTS